MYTRILVPLDGSPRAEQILPHVESLAKTNNAEVIFLQVIRPSVVSDGYKGILIEKSKEESQKNLEASQVYLSKIEGVFREKGLATRQFAEIGSVVEAIINLAQREEVGLIAMASHGRSGLSRVFYGSVAAGVLQCVDRPLLLVRSRQET